jgi:hypothetical protein
VAQCRLDLVHLVRLPEELQRDVKRFRSDESHFRRKSSHALDESLNPPPNIFVDVECKEEAHEASQRLSYSASQQEKPALLSR